MSTRLALSPSISLGSSGLLGGVENRVAAVCQKECAREGSHLRDLFPPEACRSLFPPDTRICSKVRGGDREHVSVEGGDAVAPVFSGLAQLFRKRLAWKTSAAQHVLRCAAPVFSGLAQLFRKRLAWKTSAAQHVLRCAAPVFSGLAQLFRNRLPWKTSAAQHVLRCAATAATATTARIRATRRRRRGRRRRRTRTRTKADLSCSGTAKLHKSQIVVPLHVHMSSAIAEKPLAMPNLSTHCHVSFTAFSACDSIYKHPCLTLVLCGRMFAICPPLSRYPQHSALLRGLDYTFGLSLLLWALSFPTVSLFKPVLPTKTPQLDSHECPQPEGHRRCAKLYNIRKYTQIYVNICK